MGNGDRTEIFRDRGCMQPLFFCLFFYPARLFYQLNA